MKKIKYAFLILLASLISACAQEKATHIDQEFLIYAEHFKAMGEISGKPVSLNNIVIQFDAALSGTNVLGACRSTMQENSVIVPRVVINPQFWNSPYTTLSSREQLVFHELGHCILNRGHREDSVKSAEGYHSIQASIMYPYHLGSSVYERNYTSYMKELFTGVTPLNLSYSNPYEFPAGYYAGYASTAPEVYSYKAVAKGLPETGLTDEDYKNIENFGCDSNSLEETEVE